MTQDMVYCGKSKHAEVFSVSPGGPDVFVVRTTPISSMNISWTIHQLEPVVDVLTPEAAQAQAQVPPWAGLAETSGRPEWTKIAVRETVAEGLILVVVPQA
ncbi:hypothetical protein B0H19DRAFT_1073764 [Mycena capillaripes]|nr:hypothetical protein B0H19DRAFT_1073764 [Mycena capillaripes]